MACWWVRERAHKYQKLCVSSSKNHKIFWRGLKPPHHLADICSSQLNLHIRPHVTSFLAITLLLCLEMA